MKAEFDRDYFLAAMAVNLAAWVVIIGAVKWLF